MRAKTREDDYKDSVMQDLYNDISSSESDEENSEKEAKGITPTKQQNPSKELTQDEKLALAELYQDEKQLLQSKDS